MTRLACDVSCCHRPAELLVTFYTGTRELPYCASHALRRDGTFVWKGKVAGVRTVEDTKASRFDEEHQ